jgi:hypothetical protein
MPVGSRQKDNRQENAKVPKQQAIAKVEKQLSGAINASVAVFK